jgi:hypothetical protein
MKCDDGTRSRVVPEGGARGFRRWDGSIYEADIGWPRRVVCRDGLFREQRIEMSLLVPDADTDHALIRQLKQDRGWQPERTFDRLSSDRGKRSATVTPKEGGALRLETNVETIDLLFLLLFLHCLETSLLNA